MEVYGVAQEPPNGPRVRALDVPAVGLVFAFAALLSLPQALSTFVQFGVMDAWDLPVELLGAVLGAVAYTVLQLVVGIAVAWQWRARWLLFATYLAVALAVVAVAFGDMQDDLGVRAVVALIVEMVGAPVLVVIAPSVFNLRRLHHANALGGILIVYGVSTWIAQPIGAFGQARSLAQFHAPVGAWLGALIPFLFGLAVATAGLVAGLRMAQGRPARRALAVYVILAIGGHLVFMAVRIMFGAAEDDRVQSFLLRSSIIAFATAVIKPLVVWFYARRETTPGPVDGALPWIALWFAPFLLVRCLLWDEVMAFAGSSLGLLMIVVCLALGLVLLLVARDSLHDAGVTRPWLIASAFAAVLLAITAYLIQRLELRHTGAGAIATPMALLVATTITAAWLRHKARAHTPALPVAKLR